MREELIVRHPALAARAGLFGKEDLYASIHSCSGDQCPHDTVEGSGENPPQVNIESDHLTTPNDRAILQDGGVERVQVERQRPRLRSNLRHQNPDCLLPRRGFQDAGATNMATNPTD